MSFLMPTPFSSANLDPQHTPKDIPLGRGLGSTCGRSEGAARGDSLSHGDKCVGYLYFLCLLWASLIAKLVKNPPVMQETLV